KARYATRRMRCAHVVVASARASLSSLRVEDRLTVCFEPTHPAFAGHFPDNPLVPGALLLDHAAHAAARRYGVNVRRVVRATCPALLRPNVPCEVSLADSSGDLRLTCADGERTYLSAIVAPDLGEAEA